MKDQKKSLCCPEELCWRYWRLGGAARVMPCPSMSWWLGGCKPGLMVSPELLLVLQTIDRAGRSLFGSWEAVRYVPVFCRSSGIFSTSSNPVACDFKQRHQLIQNSPSKRANPPTKAIPIVAPEGWLFEGAVRLQLASVILPGLPY